jgi:hypothetical protein
MSAGTRDPRYSDDSESRVSASLAKAQAVAAQQVDSVRLDSRYLLEEPNLVSLLTDASMTVALTQQAETLLGDMLRYPKSLLPLTCAVVDAVVLASAKYSRIPQALLAAKAAAKKGIFVTSSLGPLLSALAQSDETQDAHDAFAMYFLARAQECGVPWSAVDALLQQALLQGIDTAAETGYAAGVLDPQRELWMQRSARLLEELHAAQVSLSKVAEGLLQKPAWCGAAVSSWDYILHRGWVATDLGSLLDEWWCRPADDDGQQHDRMCRSIADGIFITIVDGHQEPCRKLASALRRLAYESPHEHALIRCDVQSMIATIEQVCTVYKLPKVCANLHLLLAVRKSKNAMESLEWGEHTPMKPGDLLWQLAHCTTSAEQVFQGVVTAQTSLREARLEQDKLNKNTVALQALFRGRTGRRHAKSTGRSVRACILMQRRWRALQFVRAMCRKVKRRNSHHEKEWCRLQHTFRQTWPHISRGRRVEIHIPSFSVSEHQRCGGLDMHSRQDLQLGRVAARAMDPNVFVVLVVAVPPCPGLLAYYDRIIAGMRLSQSSSTSSSPSASAVAELDSAGLPDRRRYHVLAPENWSRFHETLPLVQALLYSPVCVRKLRALVSGRPSYVVPGVVGPSEKRLCAELGIPMLANDPNNGWGFSNKIEARRMFSACGIDMASGSHILPVCPEFCQSPTANKRAAEFEMLQGQVRSSDPLLAEAGVESGSKSRARTRATSTLFNLRRVEAQRDRDPANVWLLIAMTILGNTHSPRWLLKITNQFAGRGHALVDCAALHGYQHAVRIERSLGTVQGGRQGSNLSAVLSFAAELALAVPSQARLSRSCEACFLNWQNFWAELLRAGGVLEEVPPSSSCIVSCSAVVLVHPTIMESSKTEDACELQWLVERRHADADKVHGDGASVWLFPLGCVSGAADQEASSHRVASGAATQMVAMIKQLGTGLVRRGLCGHITIDAVAFTMPPGITLPPGSGEIDIEPPVELWATDISCGYTQQMVSCELGHALLQGTYDVPRGSYFIRSRSEERCMVGCRMVSPLLDKALGGRCGGLAAFFRWCNLTGRLGSTGWCSGDEAHSSDSNGFQFDISLQSGGLLSLPVIGTTAEPCSRVVGDSTSLIKANALAVTMVHSLCCRLASSAYRSHDQQRHQNLIHSCDTRAGVHRCATSMEHARQYGVVVRADGCHRTCRSNCTRIAERKHCKPDSAPGFERDGNSYRRF